MHNIIIIIIIVKNCPLFNSQSVEFVETCNDQCVHFTLYQLYLEALNAD